MKPEIFLSASVPVPGRGDFFESADPFLIQIAVRELIIATIRDFNIVWGGHPAITPMIWSICEDIGISYAESVVLYQSRFFEDRFPEENDRFRNTIFVDAVGNDREKSLAAMRTAMLSREWLTTAVFIGGMEGVVTEFEMFKKFHPGAPTIALSAPGGAARYLAGSFGDAPQSVSDTVDFARLFRRRLTRPPAQDNDR